MQPDSTVSVFLYQQFIKILFCFVGVLNQYRRINYELLHPRYTDIYCTASKMVA